MPGIANLDVVRFQDRILRFDQSYVGDWQAWVNVLQSQRDVASNLGRVLRKWQACRPNRMRRSRAEAEHDPPYLEDLIAQANPSIRALRDFDMRLLASFTQQAQEALDQLWGIFRNLSYKLRCWAEVARQHSFEVARAGNRIRNGKPRIIHAAGVCVDVRERERALSSTPQACEVVSHHPRAGVRGDFTSSAPEAWRVGWDSVSRGVSGRFA